MRILITNDDGINAPGLKVLQDIATQIAGPKGEVWTVAPAFEQSGVGHCISYNRPVLVSELAPQRFAVEGSPADCVLVGICDLMKDARPDLVLSGVNRGNNAGQNTLYSGTIGGAMEAALQGIPAIALSQFLGPKTQGLANPFEASITHGAAVVQALLDQGLWERDADYQLFYNINFPPCSAAEVKGRKVVTQGWRPNTYFGVEPHLAPNGRRFLWIKGGAQAVDSGPGTDVNANMNDYIAITPMRADLTAHDRLANLEARLA